MSDVIGKRFNKLTVLEECKERTKDNHKKYKCICDCGNITYVDSRNLTRGQTKSCGCLKYKSKNLKHGKYNTKLYHIHHGMKQRCYDVNRTNYCTLWRRYNKQWSIDEILYGRTKK